MSLGLLAALLSAAAPEAWSLPAARPCSAEEVRDLTADATTPFRLRCRAVLTSGQSVSRPILIEGAEASGAGLDCGGGRLGRPGASTTTRTPTVAVWSRRIAADAWSRPTDIRIANCHIHGAVRVWAPTEATTTCAPPRAPPGTSRPPRTPPPARWSWTR